MVAMLIPGSVPGGRRLLDVQQVAEKIGKSSRWVWRAASLGEFPRPVRVGKRGSRWPEDEVEAWILGLIHQRNS